MNILMQISTHATERFNERIRWKVSDRNYTVDHFSKDLGTSKFQYLERTKKGKWKIVTKVKMSPNHGRPRYVDVVLVVCKRMECVITMGSFI